MHYDLPRPLLKNQTNLKAILLQPFAREFSGSVRQASVAPRAGGLSGRRRESAAAGGQPAAAASRTEAHDLLRGHARHQ